MGEFILKFEAPANFVANDICNYTCTANKCNWKEVIDCMSKSPTFEEHIDILDQVMKFLTRHSVDRVCDVHRLEIITEDKNKLVLKNAGYEVSGNMVPIYRVRLSDLDKFKFTRIGSITFPRSWWERYSVLWS